MDRERIREAISEIDRIIEDLQWMVKILEGRGSKGLSKLLMRKINEINILLGCIEAELRKE